MDNFYIVGEQYKHLGYPNWVFTCIGENSTHVKFQMGDGMHYYVPKGTRHKFMYKRVNLKCNQES